MSRRTPLIPILFLLVLAPFSLRADAPLPLTSDSIEGDGAGEATFTFTAGPGEIVATGEALLPLDATDAGLTLEFLDGGASNLASAVIGNAAERARDRVEEAVRQGVAGLLSGAIDRTPVRKRKAVRIQLSEEQTVMLHVRAGSGVTHYTVRLEGPIAYAEVAPQAEETEVPFGEGSETTGGETTSGGDEMVGGDFVDTTTSSDEGESVAEPETTDDSSATSDDGSSQTTMGGDEMASEATPETDVPAPQPTQPIHIPGPRPGPIKIPVKPAAKTPAAPPIRVPGRVATTVPPKGPIQIPKPGKVAPKPPIRIGKASAPPKTTTAKVPPIVVKMPAKPKTTQVVKVTTTPKVKKVTQ